MEFNFAIANLDTLIFSFLFDKEINNEKTHYNYNYRTLPVLHKDNYYKNCNMDMMWSNYMSV